MADDERNEVDEAPVELDVPERGSATELMDHGAAGELGPMRHSAAHVLAEAVLDLFPGTKLGIGPVIDDGFYYDFLLPRPLTPEDLPRIEQRMRASIAADHPFESSEETPEAARAALLELDQPFKVEIVDDLLATSQRDGTPMPPTTFYRQGPFIDLCRGPHVESTGRIGPFKLLGTAGAYWRGDEKRPMLQRVYGTAWLSQADLDKYLWRLEEAKKRDHRKLGRELDLFVFHDVAPGAPFWLPNGMVIFRQLEAFWREVHDANGYLETSTPILVNKKLWEQSGHWDHYSDNMFKLDVEEQTFGLKPMNCPESTYVYRHALRSYRDLPLRVSEIGRLHRNERSGTLTGLFRVRQITMDDAHIYCRPDQVQDEITGVLGLVRSFYRLFDLSPTFRLATRPPGYMGTEEQWDAAEQALHEALKANDLAYDLNPGDGAFYGPKIDIHIEDALGRNWQIATAQLDLTMLPERFQLEYIDADGQAKRPVAIHRAIFGSFERFIGILTEHFAGAFPTWLAPVQARVLPISEKHAEYGRAVFNRLREARVRVALDDRNEKLGYRIRDAQLHKIPYMLVVGEREAQNGTASLRRRTGEDVGAVPLDQIVSGLTAEIGSRSATLTVGRSL
jgi:threonyl-tRNA synthetase